MNKKEYVKKWRKDNLEYRKEYEKNYYKNKKNRIIKN